ncbi:MAG: hypothetical protein Q9160_004009 [Pyrenula sp. 1 TL-2023]
MADAEKTSNIAKDTSQAPPESPTTARPLDFDDEPQEAGSGAGHTADTFPKTEEAAPPKPPRPMSPQEQATNTLKEAFPSIDASVIKAVLAASGHQVEPAFNALLGMTDPDAVKEPDPPARPPRPAPNYEAPRAPQSQMEQDEMYARQLQEHYSGAGRRGPQHGGQDPRYRNADSRPRQLSDDDREHSFFDDDLPVIRDNIRKGFLDTQATVNKWVTNFKKKIDGEDSDEDFQAQPARPAQSVRPQGYSNRRSLDAARRSADRERYDADPQVLGDDFSTLELRDAEAPPPKPSRPLANPNLFKPTPQAPSDRRVSFQDGPPEEIGDMYSASPDPTKRPSSGGKTSKWQPLATVEPSPVADNDPFSLGDSDDDKDTKASKESKPDDHERVKDATAEAMAGEIGGPKKDDAKVGQGT